MRCNHCSDAPCVAICPTRALYRRKDGIVDFDTDRCIGCKSCMQACPYDALYIDPGENTAQKCNYCVHRVEVGLEPACVVVCPEQSIIAGDLDNPSTRIARLVATEQTFVRAPEQNTKPTSSTRVLTRQTSIRCGPPFRPTAAYGGISAVTTHGCRSSSHLRRRPATLPPARTWSTRGSTNLHGLSTTTIIRCHGAGGSAPIS